MKSKAGDKTVFSYNSKEGVTCRDPEIDEMFRKSQVIEEMFRKSQVIEEKKKTTEEDVRSD